MAMSRLTGKVLTPEAATEQSVTDILTTPLGSRVMLRNYGSRLYQLLDRPIDKMAVFVAVHEALDAWQPNITVQGVRLIPGEGVKNGAFVVEVSGLYRRSGMPFQFQVRL